MYTKKEIVNWMDLKENELYLIDIYEAYRLCTYGKVYR